MKDGEEYVGLYMWLGLKKMQIPLLVIWGGIIFLIVSEQRIDLNYIQQEHVLVLKNDAYMFSEVGSDIANRNQYRRDYGKGRVLFGFSQQEKFVNLLTFNFHESRQIRFDSQFHRTDSCQRGNLPNDSKIHIIVNNDNEYLLSHLGVERSDITLEVSSNDQILIRAEADRGACGAVMVRMNTVEKGSLQHYLLIDGMWIAYILLMLISGRILLPLLSCGIFYIFQEAELLYKAVLSWEQLFLFSSVAIMVGLLISLITSLNKNSFVSKVCVGVFSLLVALFYCCLPIIILCFDEIFHVQMNKYDWFAVLQTDFAETVEFVQVFATNILLLELLGFILLFLLIAFSSGRKSIRYRSVHWICVVTLMVIIFVTYNKSYFISNSFAAISEYHEDLAWLEEKAKQREKNTEQIGARKDRTDEVYVVIIGESANRRHFSLYGYPRFTNPQLSKRITDDSFVVYKQAYSCGVSTLGALRYALTSATLQKGVPQTSPSVIEVLNSADLATSWIHNGSTSLRNNLLGLIGEQAQYTDHLSSIYGMEDGKLLAEVEKALLRNTGKNKVIFLKTQGSHVAYCNRLPSGNEWKFEDLDFDRWLIPDKYEITTVSAESNCYDGSIKYTDFFIDKIIDMVENTGKIASVIYFSDHGDEVVQGTAHMGNSPTYGVFAIPMFIWFSKSYQQQYPEKYTNVVANADNIFINDVLFDSLIGLMAVDYDDLNAENDISSSSYHNGKWIYRGKKTVYDADNNIYHTPRNIKKIRSVTHSYPVYIGPLEHPFHIAYFIGEKRYPFISLDGIYRDGAFYLDSSLYNENQVLMRTVLNYLPYQSEQKVFFQIKVDELDKEVINTVVKNLFELLKAHRINKADLVVSSNNKLLLEILKNQDISVSYLLASGDSVIDNNEYGAITVDLNRLLNMKNTIDDVAIDVRVSSCDINSCRQLLFEQIENLEDKVHIRSVVLPLFNL